MQTVSKSPSRGASLEGTDPAIAELRSVINQVLTPKVQDIDLKGEYPRDIMHQLGKADAFAHGVSTSHQGTGTRRLNCHRRSLDSGVSEKP